MERLSCCSALVICQSLHADWASSGHGSLGQQFQVAPYLNTAHYYTLKCLSIGTPNTINFPFVSNGKLMVFRCPNIQAHYSEAVPKNNEFSIWNKRKIYYFRCPNT